mgnify:CR=1 FL=1
MGGHNIIIGCCLMVGINAVCEMISSTVITGAVGAALSKAHLIPASQLGRKKSMIILKKTGKENYDFSN